MIRARSKNLFEFYGNGYPKNGHADDILISAMPKAGGIELSALVKFNGSPNSAQDITDALVALQMVKRQLRAQGEQRPIYSAVYCSALPSDMKDIGKVIGEVAQSVDFNALREEVSKRRYSPRQQ